MPDQYPCLFCLVCTSAGSIEYSSTNYTAVQALYRGLPDGIKECFAVVRYDASPFYTENMEGEKR